MKPQPKKLRSISASTRPFKSTYLSGFTPLLEASQDGSKLVVIQDLLLTFRWQGRCEHLLVAGKTGSGKSTRVILPIAFADIADPDRTVIFVDAQASEVHRIIDYTRRVRGPNARIIYFNPQDPGFSTRWNPFAGLYGRKETDDIAETMVASLKLASDDGIYFRLQAGLFLSALVRATNKLTNGQSTGGMLLDLLDRGHNTIRDVAHKSGQRQLGSFLSNLQNGNRNDETTMSMLHNLLQAWNDEDVDETTSKSDFGFNVLDDEPCVLIYAMPEECVERLRPLTNAFLHRLFHFVMRRGRANGGSLSRPFSLIVDEFASAVGQIPTFHLRANTLRKRGLAIVAAVQTLAQIHEVYRDSANSLLAAFNHLIFVPPVHSDDAVYASKITGDMDVEEIVTSDGHTPLNVVPAKRPLLTSGEIATPPYHETLGPQMTFLLKNMPPFQGWLRAAYEDPEYREVMSKQFVGHVALPPQTRKKPNHDFSLSKAGIALSCADTDTTGWNDEQIRKRISALKNELDWTNTTGSARKWFEAFERDNQARAAMLLRLVEELHKRKATITEFFLAYAYSGTDSIQGNLLFLDYTRIKKKEERERRERSSATAEAG